MRKKSLDSRFRGNDGRVVTKTIEESKQDKTVS
jgi:hypothetical protein